jgi:DNA polymerase III epsilon subunit-like protein
VTRIVAIDTETTSLRADRRAWEIGLIVRKPGRKDEEHRWFIAREDLDLGNADPMALKIGRFHERHPSYAPQSYDPATAIHASELAALQDVERFTRGAHLAGAVVSFDAEVLAARMRARGICPSWHYHLIDVEALAIGWLHRHAAVLENREGTLEDATTLRRLASPPWKSDDLSTALGLTVSEEDRHTALGDAKWALRIYDAVTGRTP